MPSGEIRIGKAVKLTEEGLSRYSEEYRNKPLRIIWSFCPYYWDDPEFEPSEDELQSYDESVNIVGQPPLTAMKCRDFPHVLYGYSSKHDAEKATIFNPRVDFEVIDTPYCSFVYTCENKEESSLCNERAVVKAPNYLCLDHLIEQTESFTFKQPRLFPSRNVQHILEQGLQPATCSVDGCNNYFGTSFQFLHGNQQEQILCYEHFFMRVLSLSLELTGEKLTIPPTMYHEYGRALRVVKEEFLEILEKWSPTSSRHYQFTLKLIEAIDTWHRLSLMESEKERHPIRIVDNRAALSKVLESIDRKQSNAFFKGMEFEQTSNERELENNVLQNPLLREFIEHIDNVGLTPNICNIRTTPYRLAGIIRWVFYNYYGRYHLLKNLKNKKEQNSSRILNTESLYDKIFPNVRKGYTSRIDNSYTEFELYHKALGSFLEKKLVGIGYLVEITFSCDFLYMADIEYNEDSKIYYNITYRGTSENMIDEHIYKVDIPRIDSTLARRDADSLYTFLRKYQKDIESLFVN